MVCCLDTIDDRLGLRGRKSGSGCLWSVGRHLPEDMDVDSLSVLEGILPAVR